MSNIISNIKKNYLMLIIVIGLISLSLYSTLAMFTASVNTNDIVNLTASTLPTDTEIIEYERVSVKAGEEKTVEFTVNNSTSNSLYYGVWYEMINPSSITDDVIVAKLQDTVDSEIGQLSTGGSAKVSLIIKNKSSSGAIVNIGVAYDITNSMHLPTNRYLVSKTYVPGDIMINTTDTNKFNNRGAYTANVNCTNAEARWDYTNWKLVVSSIQAVDNCDTTFTNRSDNLSQLIMNKVGTTQGDGQIVNETNGIADYTNSTAISQSSYTNMSMYYSTSSSSTSGTSSTNAFTFSGSSWSSIPSNLTSNKYYHAKFRVSTSGYYQVCYTMSSGHSSNRLYIYKGTTQQSINGTAFLSASSSSSKNGCVDLGYVDTSTDIRIVQRAYKSSSYPIATITFNLQKATNVNNTSDYRYEGKNPNNYVLFNGELWRIIGVFDSNTHGKTGQNLTKIIRDESIGSYAWNKSNTNNWTDSSLKTILNDYYYNASSTGGDVCYFYGTTVPGNCDFTKIGLNATSRGMIENVTWHLGGHSTNSATAATFYTAERGSTVYGSNSTPTTGYIGLMYPSDYGYSVLVSSCARTTNLSSYNSSSCGGESWLLKNGYEWTMTHFSSNSDYVFNVSNFANVNYNNTRSGYAVRPTAYLKSNVYVISGTGSITDPYVIGI